LKLDLRFTEIYYELWALEEILEVIRQDAEAIKMRIAERKDPELDRIILTGDDLDLNMFRYELSELVDQILPRHLSNPFLVGTWGAFESCVAQTSELLRKATGASLKVNDIRGPFPVRARKYFRDVLGRPAIFEETEWAGLKDLHLVRNSIAHANGNKEFIKQNVLSGVIELSKRVPDISVDDRHITIRPAYLEEAFDLTKRCVDKLVNEAKDAT